MPETGAGDGEVSNAKNVDIQIANRLINDEQDPLVSCKPVPGAETMPPNKLNIAPARTIRVFDISDSPQAHYLLITCLPGASGGPNGVIDRAVVFDGSVLKMMDDTIRQFDEADWSRGIKVIENITADDDHQHVAEFLYEVSSLLAEASEDRYAMDLWETYTGTPTES